MSSFARECYRQYWPASLSFQEEKDLAYAEELENRQNRNEPPIEDPNQVGVDIVNFVPSIDEDLDEKKKMKKEKKKPGKLSKRDRRNTGDGIEEKDMNKIQDNSEHDMTDDPLYQSESDTTDFELPKD